MISNVFLSEWLRLLLTMQSCMLCTKRDDSLVTWKRSIFFSQFRSQRDEPVPHEQGWLACRKRGNTGCFCPCLHICRALLTRARKKLRNFVFRSGIVLVMLCMSLTPELLAATGSSLLCSAVTGASPQPKAWSSWPHWAAQTDILPLSDVALAHTWEISSSRFFWQLPLLK